MFAKFSIRHQFNILMEVSLPAAYSFSDKIKADTVFLAKKHNSEEVFIVFYKDKSLTMNVAYHLDYIDSFIQSKYHAGTDYVENLKMLRTEFLPHAEKYKLEDSLSQKQEPEKKNTLKI